MECSTGKYNLAKGIVSDSRDSYIWYQYGVIIIIPVTKMKQTMSAISLIFLMSTAEVGCFVGWVINRAHIWHLDIISIANPCTHKAESRVHLRKHKKVHA